MTVWRTRTTRTAALATTAALVLSSCGGGDEEPAAKLTPATRVSPSPSSTVDVPQTTELTEVGADLAFGDAATVIFEPNQKRGSVLRLTVTGAKQGRIQDFSSFVLDDARRKSTPYYVDVTVQNVGEGDVGGAAVPLWGVDATNTLLPPVTFTTTFPRCPSEPMPKKFAAKAKFSTCLVYLAPDKGVMESVSFRPNQQFDPISWTGEIRKPPAPKQPAKQPGGSKKPRDAKSKR